MLNPNVFWQQIKFELRFHLENIFNFILYLFPMVRCVKMNLSSLSLRSCSACCHVVFFKRMTNIRACLSCSTRRESPEILIDYFKLRQQPRRLEFSLHSKVSLNDKRDELDFVVVERSCSPFVLAAVSGSGTLWFLMDFLCFSFF